MRMYGFGWQWNCEPRTNEYAPTSLKTTSLPASAPPSLDLLDVGKTSRASQSLPERTVLRGEELPPGMTSTGYSCLRSAESSRL